MIRRELEKDPDLKDENWERFLPHFKTRNLQRKKVKITKKKTKDVFPPEPTPRKEDIQMETGEYFLNQQEKNIRKKAAMYEERKAKSAQRRKEKSKVFEPPTADESAVAKKQARQGASEDKTKESATAMADRLAQKASSKKKGTKVNVENLLL